MIITISGPPGSGKTTVAELLSKHNGLHLITTGLQFRALAQERGMSLDEFSLYATRNPSVDRELDRRVMEEVKRVSVNGVSVLVEGRLAAHMVKREGLPAFKVFLDAPLGVRTRRIQASGREQGRISRQDIRRREHMEEERYLAIYGIDIADRSIYDLVVDTSDKTPDAIADMVADAAGLP